MLRLTEAKLSHPHAAASLSAPSAPVRLGCPSDLTKTWSQLKIPQNVTLKEAGVSNPSKQFNDG
jgi:hypothetical protein